MSPADPHGPWTTRPPPPDGSTRRASPALEHHAAVELSREEGLDLDVRMRPPDLLGGRIEVRGLLLFERFQAEPDVLVERAVVMRDEDDLAEVVGADQELELPLERGLLVKRADVS